MVFADPDPHIAEIVRNDWGRLLAILAVQFRDLDLAEDVLQEAATRALNVWPERGTPDNPVAWLLTTARRIAIDELRRSRTLRQKQLLLEAELMIPRPFDPVEFDDDIPDERLRLIFTCCHPALGREAQVMLTLRTLGGLTTVEIARAMLMAETTVGQRISRAKRKIRDAGIPYQTPSLVDLPHRLDAVLSVLYLIYNEGYLASAGETVDRLDLANESIRLTRNLLDLLPNEPEIAGLLALMLLNQARRPARIDSNGVLVTLAEQDRSRWRRTEIDAGTALLERALKERKAGPYQIQAAISALHCEAERPEETDWAQIVALYDLLVRIAPSPIIELNRAVAIAERSGAESGLEAIATIARIAELDSYRFLHSTRAELLRRTGDPGRARAAFERALELTTNEAERAFLLGRMASLGNASANS